MPSNVNSGTRAPQTGFISPNERLVMAVSFKGKLRTGELLSGTPTVTCLPALSLPSGPSLGSPVKNNTQITIDGEVCEENEAVLVSIEGCSVNTDYVLTVKCGTTSSSQQKEVTCDLRCRA